MPDAEVRRVHITTLGCKLNQYDSEMMLTQLRAAGYEATDDAASANLAIVNTCAVTETAEKKGRAAIRTALRANTDARVVAIGCQAERAPHSLLRSGAHSVAGNLEKLSLLDILGSAESLQVAGAKHAKVWSEPQSVAGLSGRTRAFVKIQDGCSQTCTYCIVPRLRGQGRSRPIESVIGEIERIAESGYHEVVLTGVALGTYGFDWGTRDSLVELLMRASKLRGLKRLRVSSVEPWAVSDDFLRVVAESDVICPHLHVPFQSCSDPVLHRMNRRYKASDLARILNTAHKLRNDWGIGVDIITGFPGETREQFEETAEFLRDSGVTYLHVFPFSVRPGTAATRLPDVLPEHECKERADELRALSAQLRREFHARLVGSVQEVIVENRVREGEMLGHSRNYADIAIPAERARVGELLQARAVKFDSEFVYCQIQ